MWKLSGLLAIANRASSALQNVETVKMKGEQKAYQRHGSMLEFAGKLLKSFQDIVALEHEFSSITEKTRIIQLKKILMLKNHRINPKVLVNAVTGNTLIGT